MAATVIDRFVSTVGFLYNSKGLDKFARAIPKVRAKLDSFASGAARVGTVLTAAAVGALKTFADYEAKLAEIEGLVGISRDRQLDRWKGEIQEIGAATGKGPGELAKALFFVTSAGLRGETAMSVLRQSAKASAAGLGEQATIVDLLTSAINAYGKENLNATDATDALTEAVRLGKLEPATLATAMGRILPISSAMGVKFKEIAGLLAAMSRTGTTAEEGVTQLSSVMNAFLQPSDEAEKALARVGLSAQDLRDGVARAGLFPVLRTLRTAFGDNNQALAEIFPNIRALRGVFDLLGPGMEVNIGIMTEMEDSTGVLDEAFVAVSETLKFRWSQAVSQFQFSLTEVGKNLKPLAIDLINFARRVMDWFSGLPEPAQRLVTIVLAAGPALLAMAAAAKAVSFILGALGSPVGLIVAAIAALAVGAVLLIKHWDKVSAFFGRIIGKIRGFLEGVPDLVLMFIPFIGIPALIIKHWGIIGAFFAKMWGGGRRRVHRDRQPDQGRRRSHHRDGAADLWG